MPGADAIVTEAFSPWTGVRFLARINAYVENHGRIRLNRPYPHQQNTSSGVQIMSIILKIKRAVAITAALATWATPLLIPAHAAAQEIPAPVQRCAFLEGTWTGQATVTAQGDTLRFVLTFAVTRIANGLGYYVVGTANIPGLGAYQEASLLGYDAGKDLVHLFSVTTTGETHDHAGRFDRAGNIVFKYEGVKDGKRYVETIPMTFTSPTEFSFTSTVTVGRKVMSVFQATMRKG